jgi:hypothetical protein
MVAVTMAHEHVFDVSRIESQFREPAHDFIFDGIGIQRIDHDDPRRRDDRPGGMLARADEIQVVEDFDRLRVPLRTIRHAGSRQSRAWYGCGLRRWSRRRAEPVEERFIVLTRSRFGSGDMGVNDGLRSRGVGGDGNDRERQKRPCQTERQIRVRHTVRSRSAELRCSGL